MQQTKKYKLNLIEKTDTFSPDKLAENTQTLERELTTLDQRVTTLEIHRFYAGTYIGNRYHYESGGQDWQVISLGFTPVAIVAAGGQYVRAALATTDAPSDVIEIVENGFRVRNPVGSVGLNSGGLTYGYLAFR